MYAVSLSTLFSFKHLILFSYHSDGSPDCADESDEKNCNESTTEITDDYTTNVLINESLEAHENFWSNSWLVLSISLLVIVALGGVAIYFVQNSDNNTNSS